MLTNLSFQAKSKSIGTQNGILFQKPVYAKTQPLRLQPSKNSSCGSKINFLA